ncbi:MAG: helix-turn-helix transcriptional regulator [Myxococcaceae bacterium]|nr:helix-turn-helix transcriptional regulator [Myxococcaceae bacterium]MBH2006859.1 helix-turn-helix transcriptional regulator [Myxococcaceae bacterium]
MKRHRGEQLLGLRQEARLTQIELAKKVGTTGSAISRYENFACNRYELNTIHKIVKACGGKMRLVFEKSQDA